MSAAVDSGAGIVTGGIIGQGAQAQQQAAQQPAQTGEPAAARRGRPPGQAAGEGATKQYGSEQEMIGATAPKGHRRYVVTQPAQDGKPEQAFYVSAREPSKASGFIAEKLGMLRVAQHGAKQLSPEQVERTLNSLSPDVRAAVLAKFGVSPAQAAAALGTAATAAPQPQPSGTAAPAAQTPPANRMAQNASHAAGGNSGNSGKDTKGGKK